MTYRVVLSPRAVRHLDDIYAYVREQSGAARAELVVGRLLEACRDLSSFPERGIRRDDIFPGLRVMGFRRQATIAFVVEPGTVVVHGVLGRGRDLAHALDENR